jgi:hypothetical protein
MVIKDVTGAHQQTAGVESEARKIFNKMMLPAKEKLLSYTGKTSAHVCWGTIEGRTLK